MKNKIKLTFVTSNAGKAKYFSDYFHLPVEHLNLDLPEIQSLDLKEIIEDKAKRAYFIIKKPVIVEDVSLSFDALGGLPGPLIKWFFKTMGNEGLCRLVDNYKSRGAIAEVEFALCDRNGVKVFSGRRKGSIARHPRGEAGFGWDPIFIPQGYSETWGEMTSDEKHKTSVRRLALEKLKRYLT